MKRTNHRKQFVTRFGISKAYSTLESFSAHPSFEIETQTGFCI